MIHTGRVVEEQKNYVVIATEKGDIAATLKGVAKKDHSRVLVGDFADVEIMNSDSSIPEGAIRRLHPRRNRLTRPSVANVDRIFFVTTVVSPAVDELFMDRFLFAASFHDVEVIIVFNKTDLLVEAEDRELLEEFSALYTSLGHQCIRTSAKTEENVSSIMPLFNERLSIFAGASGVGKSALMSVLFPGKTFRTGELAKHTGRGAHTTTSTILLPAGDRGFVADTPGFSHITMPEGLDDTDIAPHLPDFAAFTGSCRFANCLHENEPGCAVKNALETGTLARSRYFSYKRLVEEVRNGTKYR